MDMIEINEAFAAQALACLKAMDIAHDDSRINPNGGAIAISHPLGASGARLALKAARQLKRTGGRYALITLCVGVGQGIAMVIARACGHGPLRRAAWAPRTEQRRVGKKCVLTVRSR